MKTAIALSAFTAISFCYTGCLSENKDDSSASSQEAMPAYENVTQHTEIKEELRAKIGTDISSVVLAPEGAATIRQSAASNPEPTAFMEALEELTGSTQTAAFTASASTWEEAETGTHHVRMDRARYLFDVVEKDGAFDISEEIDDLLPDGHFLAKTEGLLAAVGVLSEEKAHLEVWNLMRASRSTRMDALPQSSDHPEETVVRPLHKVVTFFREVGGIPILGNRLVFTFKLDGTFLTMSGKWIKVNYAESQLSTDLSTEEFVDRLIDRLVEAGITPEVAERIDLRTFYKTEKNSSGEWILNLYGCAVLTIQGAKEGMGKQQDFVVDI